MKYSEWKIINEAIGGTTTLGLGKPNVLGMVGSHLQESPFNFGKDAEDDEDEDDEDSDDADDDDLDGDLNGRTEDDGIEPLKSFPPDDSENQGDLPDEETFGDEAPVPGSDDDMMALAGLGGDDQAADDAAPAADAAGDVPPEIADAGPGMDMPTDMPVTDIPCPDCNPDGTALPGEGDPNCQSCMGSGFVGDEAGGLGADLGADLGGADLGADAGADLGADLGGDAGADLGADLGGDAGADLGADLGGEDLGADAGADLGADLGGEDLGADAGALGDEDLGDMGSDEEPGNIDAEIEDEANPDDKDAEMAELMAKMQSYCRKYMGAQQPMAPQQPMPQMPQQPQQPQQYPPMQPNAPGSDVYKGPFPPANGPQMVPTMSKKMVKFMTKGGQEIKFMAKDGGAGRKFMKKDDKKFCGKGCDSKKFCNAGTKFENTDDMFLASLRASAARKSAPKTKRSVTEDALFQAVDPSTAQQPQPQPGQPGFAPQGRVGGIGNGYTMADFEDIPVLGESTRYPTYKEWLKTKK